MTDAKERQMIDDLLEKEFYYRDLCGLAAGIGSAGGGLEYSRALGLSNVSTGRKLEITDVFHMASVAKLFTGTAVMFLAEQGDIDPDEKLAFYLPWFRMDDKRYERITVRQMLTHTSGMPDVRDYHWELHLQGGNDLKAYVMSEELTAARLLRDPEEGVFSYSNIAYDVLGSLIEEVSGMDFEGFITERIFRPLKMNRSAFRTFQRRDGATMCAPHEKDEQNRYRVLAEYPYSRSHAPSSTLTSTLSDMAIWAATNLRRKVLKSGTYDMIWKEYAEVPNNGEHIGISWFVRKYRGHLLYGHEGADTGFRSSFWICPENDMFMVICANASGSPVKKIGKKILDEVLK